MHKLLVVLLGAAVLAACSSTSNPQSSLVYKDCSDAKAEIKNDHSAIAKAIAHRDAYTLGTLELKNRDIVHANMRCFPNVEKQVKYWQKAHKDMEK